MDQFQTLSITRFRYTCPIKKKCSMNEGSKPKSMGYKQYAIHAGHEHNMVLLDIKTEQSKSLKTTKTQVELAMRADVSHSKELAHVLEAFKAARLAEVI